MILKKIYIIIIFSLLINKAFSQEEILMDSVYATFYYSDIGDFSMVKTLIEDYNINPNIRDYYGVTPLMYAAQSGHDSIVTFLIKKGANVNLADSIYYTSALISAVKNNFLSTAEILIRNGADINYRDIYGRTALHYAAMYGYSVMCDMLLYYEASTEIRDQYNYLPFHYALINKNNEILNLLWLDKELNYDEKLKLTHLAAKYGNSYYLENFHTELIDYVNSEGLYPLEVAVLNGKSKAVKWFLDNGFTFRDTILPNVYSLRTLSKYSGDFKTKRIVRKLKISDIHYPYFGSIGFSYNVLFNDDDLFNNFSIHLHELRYGYTLNCGTLLRFNERKVLIPYLNNAFLQLRERRNAVYIGLSKEFKINNFNSPSYFSILLDAKAIYNWGKYDGMLMKVPSEIIPSYSLGLSYKNVKNFKIYLNINYYDIGIIETNKFFIDLGIEYMIKIRKNETNEKYKYIIRY